MILTDLEKRGLIQPPKWLGTNSCYLAIVGSESYGASMGSSDRDIQGFCIPPKDDIFPHLRGEIPGFGPQHERFSDWQKHHIFDPDRQKEYDFCVYSIVTFFQLAMDNNPNILDIISVPTRCVVHATEIGQMVRDNRKMFYTTKCFRKFRGYAFRQMSNIEKGVSRDNPKRAADIAKYGFDVKFLMHVCRLALECEQLLLTGDLDLEANSQFLLSIRRGEMTLEDGKKWWTSKERDLETAYANCTVLPHDPNIGAIKNLLLTSLEMHYGNMSDAITFVPEAITLINEIDRVLDKYRKN